MDRELQSIIDITYEMEEKINLFQERVAKGDITKKEFDEALEEAKEAFYDIIDYLRIYWRNSGLDPEVIEAMIKDRLGNSYRKKDF